MSSLLAKALSSGITKGATKGATEAIVGNGVANGVVSSVGNAIGTVATANVAVKIGEVITSLIPAGTMLLYGIGTLYFFYLVNAITMFIQGACTDETCKSNTRQAVLWMTLIAVIGSIIPLILAVLRLWGAVSALRDLVTAF